MSIDYSEKIPNNVDLASNKTLQRALEHWQPEFLDWWGDMGPDGTASTDVYLRTAVSVEPKGWAHFDYVKMPRLPLGHLPRAGRGRSARSTSARTRASRRGRRCRANTARTCAG